MTSPTLGLVLAAGAGRRMGGPKALIRTADGTAWVRRAVDVLQDAGCAPIVITIGAAADAVRAALEPHSPSAELVEITDWSDGMGASLRAGLAAASHTAAHAVVVMLVDLVDVDARVVRRLVAEADVGTSALARAAYDGVPGHPVLLGRDHWDGVAARADGDQGARAYLRRHTPALVECGDLATGRDVDRPEDLPGLL